MTPTWREMVQTFGRIGLLSFGGPAAQISLMHEELVTRRGWLQEDGFLRGLGFCTLLPGPEAMQLATYAGWRLRGTRGGLLAGALFVLPGAFVMVALAAAYLHWGRLPLVEAAFLGVKAAALAIVAGALWKLRQKALNGPLAVGVALAAFVALFVFNVPFWAVLGGAICLGLIRGGDGNSAPADPVQVQGTGRTILTWLVIWWLPLLVLLLLAPDSVPAKAGVFFSWLATVSFGGAYAVLAALAQNAVEVQGWLSADQMIDGLGLAETTPGPLILVTVFTGWLGGAQSGVGTAIATAFVTLWATFVPCFLWIFAGAPHLERLTAMPRLRGALDMVSAAVAGVIANLSVWFAIHVLFVDVIEGVGPPRPVWTSLDPVALTLAVFALVWLLVLKRGLLETLALSAMVGAGLFLLGA